MGKLEYKPPITLGCGYVIKSDFYLYLPVGIACHYNEVKGCPMGDRVASFIGFVDVLCHEMEKDKDKFAKYWMDGRYWYAGTMNELEHVLPFVGCRSTIKAIIQQLVNDGALIVEKPNVKCRDSTCWYALNYDVLNKIDPRMVGEWQYGAGNMGAVTSDKD